MNHYGEMELTHQANSKVNTIPEETDLSTKLQQCNITDVEHKLENNKDPIKVNNNKNVTLLNQALGKKTGMQKEEIQSMMDNETWMTAQEAYQMGFIDVINEGVQMVAQFKDEKLMFQIDTY